MSIRRAIPWWVIILLFLAGLAAFAIFSGCTPRAPFTPPPTNPFAATGNAEAELQALFTWAVAVALFGVGASIAATVFLSSVIPSLAKWGIAGAMGFGAILILAVFFKVSLPFLPWIALALLAVAIGLGIYYLRNHPDALKLKAQAIQASLVNAVKP